MALEIIPGSLWRPVNPLPLFSSLRNASRLEFDKNSDVVVSVDDAVMYYDIELYYWGVQRHHIFKVLFDNKIWYVFHEREFVQIG